MEMAAFVQFVLILLKIPYYILSDQCQIGSILNELMEKSATMLLLLNAFQMSNIVKHKLYV